MPSPAVAPAGRSRTGWIVTAIIVSVAVIGALGLVAVSLLGTSSSTAQKSSPVSTVPRSTGGTASGGSSDLDRRAAEAGVAVLGAEGAATHTHTLVVMTVDGRPVKVPASIGIDLDRNRIAVVHTHDTTGLVHVESPEAGDSYTLGQFLIVAGMPDDASMCQQVTGGACTVHIEVGQPTDDERALLENYGGAHRGPPVESQAPRHRAGTGRSSASSSPPRPDRGAGAAARGQPRP
jgi:hypothetical protein